MRGRLEPDSASINHCADPANSVAGNSRSASRAILSVPPLEPSRLRMLVNCSALRIRSSWEPVRWAWPVVGPGLQRLGCLVRARVARGPAAWMRPARTPLHWQANERYPAPGACSSAAWWAGWSYLHPHRQERLAAASARPRQSRHCSRPGWNRRCSWERPSGRPRWQHCYQVARSLGAAPGSAGATSPRRPARCTGSASLALYGP